MKKKYLFAWLLSVNMILSLAACGTDNSSVKEGTGTKTANAEETVAKEADEQASEDYSGLVFDNSAWSYDEAVNCYYQIGIPYCNDPETLDYETLAVYVPGEYMDGEKNEDGTYTCEMNASGEVNGYTAETAPVVIPVKTPGYMAFPSQTEYDFEEARAYVNAGLIYVHAGCRGRNNGYDEEENLLYSGGAPWGVTDLKAAVRYLRFNGAQMPGDEDTVFTFGMSGGGAQSALMGSSGNSDLYTPYLKAIGAVMTDEDGNPISDAVTGAMCWCPVTSLDIGDEAYEWNMGQFRTDGMRAENSWGNALSDDLAENFAEYLNQMEFKDEDGNVLALEESKDGIWMSGSYYDYLMNVVDTSLNNYLADNGLGADYIQELNEKAGEEWISYDEETGTAAVSDMESFVTNWKPATKEVGAFDDLSGTQPENHLFGNDESDVSHFDSTMAHLLEEQAEKYAAYENWDDSYVEAYADGVKTLDKLGTDMGTRQDMYNPLYFLSEKLDGYGTSDVASYWRINTGLMQGDTSLTTEVDLYLALQQLEGTDAQFTTVWDQPHVEAERTGDYTENFIDWVFDSLRNDTKRTVRESGAGEPSVVKSASKAGNSSQYEIAKGYDLYEEFEHYFEGMDQNVTILASLSSDQTKMNLQFDFFEDKQDVSLEYQNDAWVVTEDASGFMSQDGPVIADEAMEKDGWQAPKTLESQYEPAVGYEMYEVFEYYFKDMDQTVVIMASANTVQTKMNLQFDFFEDKQDVTLEYQNDAWVVTEDASGFMSQEGPVIAQAAIDFDGWQVK